MVIHYPNGKPYHTNRDKLPKKMQVKKRKTEYGNRGMRLEEAINQSIAYYRASKQAVIHKKPTPIQIVHVDYPKRSAAKITEAYFKRASTTDYNGIYKGYYIDFEAKETKNKKSFPLKNFHQHQIDHMKECSEHGGFVFVLLYFSSLGRYFVLESEDLFEFWDQQFEPGGAKSIPLAAIEERGHEVPIKLSPRIPFLPVIDSIISQKNSSN